MQIQWWNVLKYLTSITAILRYLNFTCAVFILCHFILLLCYTSVGIGKYCTFFYSVTFIWQDFTSKTLHKLRKYNTYFILNQWFPTFSACVYLVPLVTCFSCLRVINSDFPSKLLRLCNLNCYRPREVQSFNISRKSKDPNDLRKGQKTNTDLCCRTCFYFINHDTTPQIYFVTCWRGPNP